jgi:hypothetical protein
LAAGRLVRPFDDAVDCEPAYYLIHRPKPTAIPELRRSRIGSALKRKRMERMLASGAKRINRAGMAMSVDWVDRKWLADPSNGRQRL